MPREARYKAGSVIYFQGEKPDSIYLIKSGSVSLKNSDKNVSKGKQGTAATVKSVKKGEFFGLYSAIGNYPRQEDAVSLEPLTVLLFDEKEFEFLIAKNPRLSLQLMKMLSQELRRIHQKSRHLLEQEQNMNLASGLYTYIELYVKNGENEKAKYVINKFLEAYPNDVNAPKVRKKLQEIGDV